MMTVDSLKFQNVLYHHKPLFACIIIQCFAVLGKITTTSFSTNERKDDFILSNQHKGAKGNKGPQNPLGYIPTGGNVQIQGYHFNF